MQKILFNFFKIGSVEAGARVLSWLTPFLLSMLLSVEQYGFITIFIAVENILLAFYLVGLDKAMLRFGGDLKFRKSLVKSCVTIWKIQAVFLTLACYLIYQASFIFLDVSNKNITPITFLVFLVGVSFVALNKIHNAQMRVFNDTKGYFLSRFSSQALRLLAVLSFVFFSGNATGYIYGTLIFVVAVSWQASKEIKSIDSNLVTRKEIMRFSWPYVPHALAAAALAYGDKLILKNHVSLESVGVYGFAYLAGSAITFAYGVMGSYFEPYFYKKSRSNRIRPVVYISAQILIGLVAGLILISSLKMTGFADKFQGFLSISLIILCAYLFHPIYLSGNYVLARKGRTALIARGSFLGGGLTIFLTWFLAPKFGMYGAAIATVFGFGVLSLYIGLISGLMRNEGGNWIIILWLTIAAMAMATIIGMYWIMGVVAIGLLGCTVGALYSYGFGGFRC